MDTAAVVHGFLAAYNGFSIIRCESIIGGLYMTNYKEVLRLAALGIQKQDIATSCQCSRNTVRNVLNAAQERSITFASSTEKNFLSRKAAKIQVEANLTPPSAWDLSWGRRTLVGTIAVL